MFCDLPECINFTRKQFIELLEIPIKESPFIFDNELYIQTDGASMGFCLGPPFAYVFSCFHEDKWIDDCPDFFKPVLYKRFFDDTFLLFNILDHDLLFLIYLNYKHKNIKFTCDITTGFRSLMYSCQEKTEKSRLQFIVNRRSQVWTYTSCLLFPV